MKLIIAIIFLISLCGCAPSYVTPHLPMPSKPDMPSFTNEDIKCVSDNAYSKIAGRDAAHKLYEGRLEAVIKSTWGNK